MTQRITELERKYVAEVLDTEFRSSAGSRMSTRLEAAFAKAIGVEFAISFVNGTATLHAALVAAGVGPGDEVIVPPLTMASTAFAVVQAGADPIFVDIDRHTFTLDPELTRQAISPRTKAIVPVSIYGQSADLDPLMELANEYGLFVLEDDAECFGGKYHNRHVGALGHAASFSFQSSKQLTAGEGGIITTNDRELANAIRRFGSLGYQAVGATAGKITKDQIQHPSYLRHASIGYNYRMSELNAAVALAQVERMEDLLAVRTWMGARYQEIVRDYNWLQPQAVPADRTNTYWTYALVLNSECNISWEQFRQEYLAAGGEPFYACWQLNYLEPAFRERRLSSTQRQHYGPGLCPIAEQIQPQLVQLKTNAWSEARQESQVLALATTLKRLDSRA